MYIFLVQKNNRKDMHMPTTIKFFFSYRGVPNMSEKLNPKSTMSPLGGALLAISRKHLVKKAHQGEAPPAPYPKPYSFEKLGAEATIPGDLLLEMQDAMPA